MNWIGRHWFLLALSCVLLLAFFATTLVQPLLELETFRKYVVAGVLFLMALPLPLGNFIKVLLRPQAALLAIALNIGLAPLLALPFLPMLGPELAGGLAIAVSTPCTLASAAVWTRRAQGDDVTALMVTVVTNLACVVVTPLWLLWLTDQQDAQINLLDQIRKLSTLVLLPIVAAQLVRVVPSVGKWATGKKSFLSIMAQVGLLYIVLLGSTASFLRWRLQAAVSPTGWLIMAVAIISIHLGLFVIGLLLSGWLKMTPANRKAVAIAGSQKTLMVGAEMGLSLNLSILPLLLYHIFQLFADTLLADWLRRHFEPSQSLLDQ